MAVKSPLQQVIVDFLKGKGISQREFAKETGASDSAFSTYSRMSSAMGIDLLDEILVKFPDVKKELIAYLGGFTDISETKEKHTPATKSDEAGVVDVLERTVSILRDENMKLLNIVELALKRGGSDGAE